MPLNSFTSTCRETPSRHPDYAPAHSMLAFGLVLAVHMWRTAFEVPKLAIDSARRAAELDDRDPWAHLALGYVAFVRRQTNEAVAQFRYAIELNPNFAAEHGYLGYPLAFDAHYLARRYDQAIEWGRKAVELGPSIAGTYRILIASLAQTGQIDEAHALLVRLARYSRRSHFPG